MPAHPLQSRRAIAAVLIVAIAASASAQRTGAPLSRQQAAVRQKVAALHPHDKISVIPLQGQEEFGDFVTSDTEGFTFHDVDHNTQVTMRYAEVKKIKLGYGGYNSIRQRHIDPTRRLAGTLIVAGILAALIVAVVVTKD